MVDQVSFGQWLECTEHVTKKFQLAVLNQMNQRHRVSHGIDGGVQIMVNALYIQHDSVA